MLKKCKELLSKYISVDLNLIYDEDGAAGAHNFTKKDTEISQTDLNRIKKYLDETIGNVIVAYEAFDPEIEELEPFIKNKVISRAKVIDGFVRLELNDLNGNKSGFIDLVLSPAGSFSEKRNEDEEEADSVYRIIFMNGFCLEYIDPSWLGEVYYGEDE